MQLQQQAPPPPSIRRCGSGSGSGREEWTSGRLAQACRWGLSLVKEEWRAISGIKLTAVIGLYRAIVLGPLKSVIGLRP